jgi:hypothetical protein
MLRHGMLLQAWCRIDHRVGVSTAGEPAMDRLWNAASTNHKDRGDIFAVLPSGLVVADVSIVHPAALPTPMPPHGLVVLLLHLVMHSSCVSIMLAGSPLPCPLVPCQWSLLGISVLLLCSS